jgi:hypothetical protein
MASGVRMVAQRERLTRCGYGAGDGDRDRVTLRALHGRRGALDCPTDIDPDTGTSAGLVDDGVAVRTMRAARIADRCTSTRRALQRATPHTAGVEHVLPRDSEEA